MLRNLFKRRATTPSNACSAAFTDRPSSQHLHKWLSFRCFANVSRNVGGNSGQTRLDNATPLAPQWIHHHARLHLPTVGPEDCAAYWGSVLREGDLPVLQLPADIFQPRGKSRSLGGTVPVQLEASLIVELEALAAREDATLLQVFVSLWALLLCRHAGQHEVVVGLASDGSLVPLLLAAPIGSSSSSLLQSVRTVAADAHAHAALPIQAMVEVLPRLERDISRGVFQTMVSYNSPEEVDSRLDVSLSVWQACDNTISAAINYSSLFTHKTMERFATRLPILARAMARSEPSDDVWRLPLMPPYEVEETLMKYNDTYQPRPSRLTVHGLVAAQAVRTPHSPAIEWRSKVITYSDLEKYATEVAMELVGRGAALGSVVALQLQRGVAEPVAVLGVLKAGCAFLPLDPTWSEQRRRIMMEDVSCTHLVIQHIDTRREFEWFRGETIKIDDSGCLQPPVKTTQLAALPSFEQFHADALMYVMFTSGSTGTPKGCRVTHASCANLLLGMQERFREELPAPGSRYGVTAAYFFDQWVEHMFLGLTTGCVCSILDDHLSLAQLSPDSQFDAFFSLPSAFALATLPATARFVQVAGEPLSSTAIDAIEGQRNGVPGRVVVNEYGPVESNVVTTKVVVSGNMPPDLGNIGSPLPNVTCYVVNPVNLELQPPGVWGELLIGGVQVCDGYVNRAELTKEKFIPNPWPFTDPSGRGVVYRTGDLCRWYPDGSAEIEIKGRIDNQVKIRGFRIELGEVEHALRAQPEVSEAVVLKDEVGGGSLLAYVAPASAAIGEEVLAALRSTLPTYMMPRILVGVDEWPRTATGKIDRRSLPAPTAIINRSAALDTCEEKQVQALVAEVMGSDLETIDMSASFVALGGNSLSALRLARLLAARRHADTTATDVLTAPTIRELVEAGGAGAEPLLPPLKPMLENIEGSHPASWAQSHMLTVHLLDQATSVYNLPLTIWWDGPLNCEALSDALTALLERNAVLRTTFAVETDGSITQQVQPSNLVKLAAASADSKADALAFAEVERKRPFDLLGGEVLRCLLVEVASQHNLKLFQLTVHHIALDGFSLNMLWAELGSLYQHFSQKLTTPVALAPAAAISYVDFALWQRQVVDSSTLEHCMSYWRSVLREGDLPALEFPIDHPRPPVQDFAGGGAVPVRLESSLVSELDAFAAREGATLFQVLLSVWALMLCRHAGQQEIVVGVPYHGRDLTSTSDVLGNFISMLPLLLSVPRGSDAAALVQDVRTASEGGTLHAALPFQAIIEMLPRLQRDPSRGTAFQTLFAWDGDQQFGSKAPDLGENVDASLVSLAPAGSPVELSLRGWRDSDQSVSLMIEYSKLFKQRTIERLARRLPIIARALASASRGDDVWRLPLMYASELEETMIKYNDTYVPRASDLKVHGLIEAQAAQTPNVAAVEWRGEVLTYSDLEVRAAALAAALIRRGAAPGSVVALQFQKSLALPVSVLGVLKAGCAFVPLDPCWPVDRRRFMIEDAACTHLITQQSFVLEVAKWFAGDIVVLDDAGGGHPIVASALPHASLSCDDESLMSVLFTSGSTGKPKGVLVPHAGMANLVRTHLPDWCGILEKRNDELRYAVSWNYVFDAFYLDLFVNLSLGATCVLIDHTAEALSLLANEDYRIQAIHTAPSAVPAISLPSTLALLNVGGEALTESVLNAAQAGMTCLNRYGPTEVSVTACVKKRIIDQQPMEHLASIGPPLPNVTCYVVDPTTLELQPPGVWGELLLGGVQVCAGYLNRPELTAEKFIPHPWPETDPSGRGTVYRTGDLCRWYTDGSGELEFAGRIDFQVKLRGHRLELGEVEHALRAQAGVDEAVVLLHAHGGGSLVGYISPASAISDGDLIGGVRQILPAYMVPAQLIGIDDWPRMSTGKIDRGALPAPLIATNEDTQPRTDAEATVQALIAEVLRLPLDAIGIDAEFSDLGGNSLAALRLANLLSTRCGINARITDVVALSSIRRLAALL